MLLCPEGEGRELPPSLAHHMLPEAPAGLHRPREWQQQPGTKPGGDRTGHGYPENIFPWGPSRLSAALKLTGFTDDSTRSCISREWRVNSVY